MINQQLHNQPDWPSVIFAAEREKEPFEDVQVVTARCEYVNLAYQAATEMLQSNQQSNIATLHALAKTLIATQKLHIQEYVRVDQTGITVCLNVRSTEHDDVMWLALDRVSAALNQLDGDHGVVFFGPELRFSLSEVSSLLKQMA